MDLTNAAPEPTEQIAAEPTTDTTPSQSTPDPLAILDTIDPKVLRAHPRFAGVFGQEVDERANRIAERRLAQMQAERERQAAEVQRKQLMDNDPIGFVELARKEEADRTQKQSIDGEYKGTLTEMFYQLPHEQQAKISGKHYDAGPAGVRQYFEDITALRLEAATAKAVADTRAGLEKDILPAVRKDVMSEVNGGRPTPDINRTGPRGRVTPDDLKNMSNAEYIDWKSKNKGFIEEIISAANPKR